MYIGRSEVLLAKVRAEVYSLRDKEKEDKTKAASSGDKKEKETDSGQKASAMQTPTDSFPLEFFLIFIPIFRKYNELCWK